MPSDSIIQVDHSQIQLLQGDITTIAVDAIVNAANSQLIGGGGVDGAIHLAGGPDIMAELNVIRSHDGPCQAGRAVVTSAGRLPAKYIFHAVGPIYQDGQHGEAETLASCYKTCLQLATERNIESLSFPSISTGVYGYPIHEGAEIAVQTVTEWLRKHNGSVHLVKLVQFSYEDHIVYKEHAQKLRKDLVKHMTG